MTGTSLAPLYKIILIICVASARHLRSHRSGLTELRRVEGQHWKHLEDWRGGRSYVYRPLILGPGSGRWYRSRWSTLKAERIVHSAVGRVACGFSGLTRAATRLLARRCWEYRLRIFVAFVAVVHYLAAGVMGRNVPVDTRRQVGFASTFMA